MNVVEQISSGIVASGIGSLPGTDMKDAVAQTFGELPDLPYLPELPGRGPGDRKSVV